MKRQTAIFFYVLSTYVVLQFIWWGFHLIELSSSLTESSEQSQRRILMIIGEGSVFFILLLVGIWKIRSSIQRDLDLSNRQSNFLLSVTHELKTPLSSNKLYLQTLLKRKALDRTKQEELLNQALLENKRLEGMIENILTATRIENHRLELVKSRINLSETIAKALTTWSRERITVSTKIEPEIFIKGDVFIFETILFNLLDNAFKYGGKNPMIEAYLYRDKKNIIFGVKDQGIGVPDKFKSTIFEKFTRIGNEETRTEKGTGLGLYIVSELSKIHGFQIECLDNEPKGTDFKITINDDEQ